MDAKQNKLEEQKAPEKNTDKAFVQVSKDGSPAMPGKKEIRKNKGAISEQQRKEASTERD